MKQRDSERLEELLNKDDLTEDEQAELETLEYMQKEDTTSASSNRC